VPYLYRIALQPYSEIIDSSTISYDGCCAALAVVIAASAAMVTALRRLLVENFAVVRRGKFRLLLRPSTSITVVS
jgi:hypothetical protein